MSEEEKRDSRKSSVCVTGGVLEASSGASQASGGSKQAGGSKQGGSNQTGDSRNHISSSPGGGLNSRQEALGGGGDRGGKQGSSCSQSGGISTVSNGESTTGM